MCSDSCDASCDHWRLASETGTLIAGRRPSVSKTVGCDAIDDEDGGSESDIDCQALGLEVFETELHVCCGAAV